MVPSVGFRLRMITLLAPRRRICSKASRFDPSPIASIAITEPTPRITPRTVRKLRNLRSSKFFTPTLRVFQNTRFEPRETELPQRSSFFQRVDQPPPAGMADPPDASSPLRRGPLLGLPS